MRNDEVQVSIRELLSGQPGLRISDPRHITVELHSHLRQLIINGTLPEGTELKQAELARAFAISRTPMREAFRMLQEEGLISADPNYRSRVLGFSPEQLDSLYAVRIMLESLGVRLTTGRLSAPEVREATAALQEMERTRQAQDLVSWAFAHRRFHSLMVCRADGSVRRTTTAYAEMSERYVRADQIQHPDDAHLRHQEHLGIHNAVLDGEAELAVTRMAHHIAGTAFRVIEHTAPGTGAPAVTSALELITGGTYHEARAGDLTAAARRFDSAAGSAHPR